MNLFDTNLVLAVRCSNCGKISFHDISMFRLPLNHKTCLYCDCGSIEAAVSLKDNRTMMVDMPCLACDIKHTYIYSINDVLKRKVTVICCNETGLELCFMGRERDVRNVVSRYQEDLDLLLGELGFVADDDIFKGRTNRKS